MKNKVREQAVDYIVKEFNLLPYQEYVLRKMMTHKYCFIPPLRRDSIYLNSLLAMTDLMLKRSDKTELESGIK